MAASPVTQDASRESAPERWFRRTLGFAAALVMFTMMMVTFVDVIGRDFFDFPLPGGFEVTELLLASLIFLGLPLVTAEAGHVDVDLMDNLIPRWLKPVQNLLIKLVNITAFSILTGLMWQFAIRTYQYQDTTAILQIPYAGLTFLMAITCTLATLALVAMLLTGRKQLIKPDDEHQA